MAHRRSWQAEFEPRATILRAIEVPNSGGDTLFADATSAFRDLSSGMQKTLRAIYRRLHARTHSRSRRTAMAAVAGDQSTQKSGHWLPAHGSRAPDHRCTSRYGGAGIYCTPVHTHRHQGLDPGGEPAPVRIPDVACNPAGVRHAPAVAPRDSSRVGQLAALPQCAQRLPAKATRDASSDCAAPRSPRRSSATIESSQARPRLISAPR